MTVAPTFDRDCSACPIRHRAICATCEPEELERLNNIKYYRTYDAGQPVTFAGDRMEFVASVVAGTATMEHLSADGRKQTVGLLLPSDFIGRPGRENAVYDVTAVTDLTLCCFRRKQFEQLIEDTPHVAQRMLEMALDELDAARDWMFLLGRKTALEKIASFLILVHRRNRDPESHRHEGSTLTLPLTREAMADYLGLTLETVSRQFSKLKSQGHIRLIGKRQVEIPNIEALEDIAGYSE